MWRTYLAVVCRSAAKLKQPLLEPSNAPERAVAPEPGKRPEVAATFDAPPSASDAEVLGDRDAAGFSEPLPHPEVTPANPEPMDSTGPKASAPDGSNEIPVGLIEGDLLSANLCNEVVGSLRRTYRHFKVTPFLCHYHLHIVTCMFMCSLFDLCRE